MLDNSTSLSPEDIVKIRDAAANYINNILPEQKVKYSLYNWQHSVGENNLPIFTERLWRELRAGKIFIQWKRLSKE